MIGRASIGYPWIFNEVKAYLKDRTILDPPSIEERVDTTRKHLEFSLQWKGDRQGVLEMRRHYTNYFRGIPNFKPIRTRLVETMDPQELFDILNEVPEMFKEELV